MTTVNIIKYKSLSQKYNCIDLFFKECTFLILDKEKYEQSGNEIESLIGDTNLFMLLDDDEEREASILNKRTIAEAEIMIAETSAQHKHFGWESMLLMLAYGQRAIGCTRFVVKIGFANERSLLMFKKMQFVEVSRSEVFEEITLQRPCTNEWLEWLAANVEYTIDKYHKG